MPFGMLVLELGKKFGRNEKARQKAEAGFAADGPTKSGGVRSSI
jgi:hypothetical protein